MANEIVPFGKYEGQPVEVLLSDTSYANWLAEQEWFREKYPVINNIIVHNYGQPAETPEHNQFVAKFFDIEYLVRFLSFFYLSNREISKLYNISADLIQKWKTEIDYEELLKEQALAKEEKEKAKADFNSFVGEIKIKTDKIREVNHLLYEESEKARKEFAEFINTVEEKAKLSSNKNRIYPEWGIKENMASKYRDRVGVGYSATLYGNVPPDIASEWKIKEMKAEEAEKAYHDVVNWGIYTIGNDELELSRDAPEDVKAEWKEKEERVKKTEEVWNKATSKIQIYNSIDAVVSSIKIEADAVLERKIAYVETEADGFWDVRISCETARENGYIGVIENSVSRNLPHNTTFLCELKPVIGDDFPAVIRQIKSYIRKSLGRKDRKNGYIEPTAYQSRIWDGGQWEQDSYSRSCGKETIVLMVYREFNASGVSEANMKAMFKSANIYALSEAEILNANKCIREYTYVNNKTFNEPHPFFTAFSLTDGVMEDKHEISAFKYDYKAIFERERAIGRLLTDSELKEFIISA